VVTREEVRAPKPDPEIYVVLAARLALPAAECLVVEDSVPGVRAALAAGMHCVAAATALTRASLRAAALLPPALVVDDAGRSRAPGPPPARLRRAGGLSAGPTGCAHGVASYVRQPHPPRRRR
jgi:hypothetical protein